MERVIGVASVCMYVAHLSCFFVPHSLLLASRVSLSFVPLQLSAFSFSPTRRVSPLTCLAWPSEIKGLHHGATVSTFGLRGFHFLNRGEHSIERVPFHRGIIWPCTSRLLAPFRQVFTSFSGGLGAGELDAKRCGVRGRFSRSEGIGFEWIVGYLLRR